MNIKVLFVFVLLGVIVTEISAVDLNAACSNTGECTDTNAECVDTDETAGVDTCKCNAGFKDVSGTCVPKGLNDDCSDTTDCSDVTNAVCSTDSKCTCGTGYVANDGACDQVLTSIDCSTGGDNDCPDNAICNDDAGGAASTKAMVWMMFSSLFILLVVKLLM